jgi:hypothetical protein
VSRRPGTLATVVLLGCLALTACGGDEESEPATSPKRPELTVPGGGGTDPATTTETAPGTQPPAQTAPPTAPTGTTPDSPGADAPPPAGSPAERFEKFCDENPGACE